MDNTAQKKPVAASNRGGIPVDFSPGIKDQSGDISSTVAPSTNPPAPAAPVGGPKGKEREPLPTPFPDVVNMSETEVKNEEHEVERELEKIIEQSPQDKKPDVSDEVKAIGVELAGEDMDMPSIQIGPSKLPMGYEEAAQTRKQYRWKDSVAWLAAVIMYHWKRFNFVNKKK